MPSDTLLQGESSTTVDLDMQPRMSDTSSDRIYGELEESSYRVTSSGDIETSYELDLTERMVVLPVSNIEVGIVSSVLLITLALMGVAVIEASFLGLISTFIGLSIVLVHLFSRWGEFQELM